MQRKKLSLQKLVLVYLLVLCLLPLLSVGGYLMWQQPANPVGYVFAFLGCFNITLLFWARSRLDFFMQRMIWVTRRVADGDLTLIQRPNYRFFEANVLIRHLNELTLALLDNNDRLMELEAQKEIEFEHRSAELQAQNQFLVNEIEAMRKMINSSTAPSQDLFSTEEEFVIDSDFNINEPLHEDTLTAQLGHELRTPLNVIVGYSELLEETAIDEGDELTADDVRYIKEAAYLLNGRIDMLLEFISLQSDQSKITKSEFKLDSLIEQIAYIIQPLAEQNGNELLISNRFSKSEIFSDEGKLRQILTHLLGRAAKSTHNSTISLDFSAQDTRDLLIEIQDSAHRATDAKQDASGLEWTITKNFVEILGGTMQVENEFGDGNSCQIKIPIGEN